HMSRSGDGARVLVSDLALAVGADSAGSRSDRATGSIRGGADTAGALAGWAIVAGLTASAASLPCMVERASRTLRTFMTRALAGACRRSMPDTLALAG